MLYELVQWLLPPISGIADHAIAPEVSWHGRIMVLAWGVAVPTAVLVARYFKVTPRQDWPRELDNKFWWHTHRTLNYLAAFASLFAALLLWNRGGYEGIARDTHAWMGWCVVTFGLLQVLGGHLRGTKGGPAAPRCAVDGRVVDLHGDHYNMTRRRIVFERLHKAMGYGALLLALCTVLLGLWTADAPRWMWAGMAFWWTLLVFVAARLQVSGKCLDTYQAIWGPSASLPGAATRPVGWGVHRISLSDEVEKTERSA